MIYAEPRCSLSIRYMIHRTAINLNIHYMPFASRKQPIGCLKGAVFARVDAPSAIEKQVHVHYFL